jgi:outer membrane protein assembly factor BamB
VFAQPRNRTTANVSQVNIGGILMSRISIQITLGLALLAAMQIQADENWPQWRGPDQNGIGKAENLPVTWSDTENIVWKTPLPWWSASSPAIWGNQIFVTSPSTPVDKNGAPLSLKDAAEKSPGGDKLLLLCIAKEDGHVLWERELDEGNSFFRKQNNTSPSPLTDGTHVWVVTGTTTITAWTMDGALVWKKNLQKEFGPIGTQFGYATSPVLCEGKIILPVLHGFKTEAPSYLVAFDALTGNVVWRVERPTKAVKESRDSYATPAISHYDGKTQVIMTGGDVVTGNDIATGQEMWRADGLNPKNILVNRLIASPIAVDGMIYAPTRKKPMLVVRANGEGDVTNTHIAWKWDEEDGTDVPTPACDGKYFYMAEDRGVITCLDPKTGKVIWGPERTASGTLSASPIVADGKIYLINESAVTTVLAAGPEFKILATNTLTDFGLNLATPAISGSQLFIRTPSYLYCIGKK